MRTDRRQFLRAGVAMSTLAMAPRNVWSAPSDDRVRLAVIGVANRGQANLNGVSNQNIVALCDVDQRYLADASKRFPDAETFSDYREMLAKLDNLDGVVVSTPDHHHAPAAIRAIQRGLHVYCEKPLTHTVQEARQLTEAAEKQGVVTQMGTQIHAGDNYRRVVELIRSNVIGPVRRVHVWVGKGWGATSMPKPAPPAPESLDWNLWLGPAADRPYTADLHPANWRRYRDFGAGTLGDMGCHYIDLPFWALSLSSPHTISAAGPEAKPEVCPLGLEVHYQFAATDHHPELELIWYDGDRQAKELEGITDIPSSGVLFVGDDGMLQSTYSSHKLYPENRDWKIPSPDNPIPASIGHHAEWIAACKGEGEALCRFSYSGPLTETVLLGTVAHQAGQPIRWDGATGTVTNNQSADAMLSTPHREGWTMDVQPMPHSKQTAAG